MDEATQGQRGWYTATAITRGVEYSPGDASDAAWHARMRQARSAARSSIHLARESMDLDDLASEALARLLRAGGGSIWSKLGTDATWIWLRKAARCAALDSLRRARQERGAARRHALIPLRATPAVPEHGVPTIDLPHTHPHPTGARILELLHLAVAPRAVADILELEVIEILAFLACHDLPAGRLASALPPRKPHGAHPTPRRTWNWTPHLPRLRGLGFTYRQLAHLVGVSEGALRVRLHRLGRTGRARQEIPNLDAPREPSALRRTASAAPHAS